MEMILISEFIPKVICITVVLEDVALHKHFYVVYKFRVDGKKRSLRNNVSIIFTVQMLD